MHNEKGLPAPKKGSKVRTVPGRLPSLKVGNDTVTIIKLKRFSHLLDRSFESGSSIKLGYLSSSPFSLFFLSSKTENSFQKHATKQTLNSLVKDS